MKHSTKEIKTKTAFFETISQEMKIISHEMKTKTAFFETVSSEMKTKTAFFETISEEMKTISREIIFISSVLWRLSFTPGADTGIRTG